MTSEHRGNLTGGLWFVSAIALTGLFISAAAQGELTTAHIILALLLIGLAVGGTFMLLFMSDDQTEETKAKRHSFDELLNELSDEELAALKRRLLDVDHREEPILDYLGDDGELKLRR